MKSIARWCVLCFVAAATLTLPQTGAAVADDATPPELNPAQAFLIQRVRTSPSPLVSGAPGSIILDGRDFLLQPGAVFSLSGPTTIAIVSATIVSDTRATLSVNVPPDSRGRHTLSVSLSGTSIGGAFLWVDSSAGTFHAVQPVRALDTRVGTGFARRLNDSESISLSATGIGEMPATGVSAIVANITAVIPSAAGYLTIWPSGVEKPVVSSVNFAAGDVVPNQVTVGVGSDGKVQIFNFGGTVDVLLDIVGWFATETGPLGATYERSLPDRIVDTRASTPVAARSTLRVPLYSTGYPNGFGARSAVVANITVTRPATAGFVTVFPAGSARPNTSTHNFHPGRTTANMVTVGLGQQNAFDIYNGSDGTVDILVDVVAYFSFDQPVPYRFEAASRPYRVLDTRGTPIARPIQPHEAVGIALDGNPRGIPDTASIVVGNVTATGSDGSGYMNISFVNVGPSDPASVSVINYDVGQTVANQFHTAIGPPFGIVLYNFTSNAHAIVDIFGWFSYR